MSGDSSTPRAAVACDYCGRTEPSPPLTWSMRADERDRTWLCEPCTRASVRAVEARLDEPWA